MQTILPAVSGLLILLAFEIRHRETFFEIAELKAKIILMDKEIAVLKAEMKLKKNVFEELNP